MSAEAAFWATLPRLSPPAPKPEPQTAAKLHWRVIENLNLRVSPGALGLLYYVMASSQTLGDALKRVARYSQTTNEALVVRYPAQNRTCGFPAYGASRHFCRPFVIPFFCSSRAASILPSRPLFEPRREHSSVPTAYFHRRRAAAR